MEREDCLEGRVAWYAPQVLPYSETFVADQLTAMPGVHSALFGVDLVRDIEVPSKTWVLRRDCHFGAFQSLLFKATRRSPALRAALRDFHPDVLIAHFLQCAWRIERVAESAGLPLVAMCHGSDLLALSGDGRHQHRGTRQLDANWAKFVDSVSLFLPVSRFLGDRLVGSGVPPSRVAVHHLGVAIPDDSDLQSAGDRTGILFVGRLVENKGCDFLLRAVGKMAHGGRQVDLTVVGTGPQKSMLMKQAAQLPAGANVHFSGSLPHQAVSSLMKAHRVVCMPSVEVASGISEGLGLVACEAAAHGRPVVVFDTGGLPETVIHGVTGLVVMPRSADSLASALDTLLVDDAVADSMGKAAREFAIQEFNVATQGRRLRDLLSVHKLIPGK